MSGFEAAWFLLIGAAACAGFVDAIAGGGGLIQVPALFAALPTEAPATLFGTNKTASIFGTLQAARRYLRAIPLDWGVVRPMAVSAFFASFLGAAAVAWLPKEIVRPLAVVLLIAVTLYTLSRPDFGKQLGKPSVSARHTRLAASLAGAALGFYDGFFGPGAGSFMIFAAVRLFGMDFLRASACAKIVNATTNAGALALFTPSGHVLWPLGLAMAAANILGAQVGSRLALARGAGFIRVVFIVMTVALIAKLVWDLVHFP
ncbi:MAG: TSUP family transporter [Rhodocyclaceae bacterium]|nr:TSUP family transporter [Rhodocyclaceae bacterium]